MGENTVTEERKTIPPWTKNNNNKKLKLLILKPEKLPRVKSLNHVEKKRRGKSFGRQEVLLQ